MQESGVPDAFQDTVVVSPGRTGFGVAVTVSAMVMTVISEVEYAFFVPSVHVSVYVVVVEGDTVAVPEVAPPVEKPVPVHELAFDDVQLSCTEPCPAMMVADWGERSAVGGGETVTLGEQFTVVEPPPVTVTEADFVPVVEYPVEMLFVVPLRPSVPLHEYVYEPEPPAGAAVQVTVSPM